MQRREMLLLRAVIILCCQVANILPHQYTVSQTVWTRLDALSLGIPMSRIRNRWIYL